MTIYYFFSVRVFFHRHWRFTGQQGKGGGHLLFHSTTSTCSRTLRHLLATLHVRWLSRIFIAMLVFTRLLVDEIYHLIELPFDWLMIQCLFDAMWYVISKYLLGGNYMILVCRNEISTSPAWINFTVQSQEEIKLNLGKMEQFSAWYLFRFVYIFFTNFCKDIC